MYVLHLLSDFLLSDDQERIEFHNTVFGITIVTKSL